LPARVDGRPIRHAVEVRHASFRNPDFIALARTHEVAVIVAGDSEHPQIADATAPFVYVRIMGTQPEPVAGYDAAALDRWADRARAWATGVTPDGLETVAAPAERTRRDVFLYVISGAKQRNPAAAAGLIERLA
jgi:uncharacterized protein YecE (DUF72 family)